MSYFDSMFERRAYPACALCKKMGLPCLSGTSFNPKLDKLFLCQRHWRLWRVQFFHLPLKMRKTVVQKLHTKLHGLNRKNCTKYISMFWDMLQMSAETKDTSHVQSFFAQR